MTVGAGLVPARTPLWKPGRDEPCPYKCLTPYGVCVILSYFGTWSDRSPSGCNRTSVIQREVPGNP